MLSLAVLIPQTVLAFSDVPQNHRNFEAIDTLSTLNIVKGYTGDVFKPDQKVNRAEMLTLVMKSAGIAPSSPPQTINFLDVLEQNWFFPYVRTALATKLIKGYPDNTFRPAHEVTISEALAMIFTAHKIAVDKSTAGQPWYMPYSAKAIELNMISRETGEANLPSEVRRGGRRREVSLLIDPQTAITRSQAAELIFRMKKITADRLDKFDIKKNWQTFRNEGNFYELRYPPGWKVFKGSNHSAIWKLDEAYQQAWFNRIYPESATLTISMVDTTSTFTPRQNIQAIYGDDTAEFTQIAFGSHRGLLVQIPSVNIIDLYLTLTNGKTLIFYGEYGTGAESQFFKQELEAIIRSFVFIERPTPPPPPTPAEKLEAARANILIEGQGLETLKQFPDRLLIETDAVGVGTGPVDYYYSAEINSTLKYERADNVILNIKEGRITNF